jgi:CheY-like chemotaxis protein
MESPTIAIVDDNVETLELVNLLLTDAGYQTIMCSDGTFAYQMIRLRKPDLVLLDLRMEHPQEGWVNLDLLRADPATAKIPVIMYSGDREFLRRRGAELQAKGCDILEKPFRADELLNKVKRALSVAPRTDEIP